MEKDEERLQKYIDAWNAQADEYNQWSELDTDERCIWILNNLWIEGWSLEL